MKQPFLQFDFEQTNILFTNPIEVITTTEYSEVDNCLAKVQQAIDNGFYVAGYLSYEVTYAFYNEEINNQPSSLPLMWFGVFSAPTKNKEVTPTSDAYQIGTWSMLESKEQYITTFNKIMKEIKQGAINQINYTTVFHANFVGNSYSYYNRLKNAQKANYNAYIQLENVDILSISPELFFKVYHNNITVKPMKGTIHRGKSSKEDATNKNWLQQSSKNRYENKLITDLMEDELIAIADTESASQTKLFQIEKYPTVYQMTSTIKRKLKPDSPITNIIKTLFPCGSISGVPKKETIKLINDLENYPREIYCGAIGYISPENEAIFNVPIRTVTIDHQQQLASYHAGGAITVHSTAEEEYEEVLTKTKFLSEEQPDFSLLETIGLVDGSYFVLEEHLSRLQASANYFNIVMNKDKLLVKLETLKADYPSSSWRIRVTLAKDGKFTITKQEMNKLDNVIVGIANEPIQQENIFHYHKTTNRSIYTKHQQDKWFDVILWNEKREITEFTIGNIVVEIDGNYYTPPIECGVLPGTYRSFLLNASKINEKVLYIEDLVLAENIWLINSVRQWVNVHLDVKRD